MATVHYPFSFSYRPIAGVGLAPALEVELLFDGQSARALGVLDSGSTHTVFSVQVAEALGIDDVMRGERFSASTLAGGVEFFIFDLEMALLLGGRAVRFPSRVGFFATRSPRNILGRIAVFSRLEVGFRERAQLLHLRPEE